VRGGGGVGGGFAGCRARRGGRGYRVPCRRRRGGVELAVA
jgi:hypothetical protein